VKGVGGNPISFIYAASEPNVTSLESSSSAPPSEKTSAISGTSNWLDQDDQLRDMWLRNLSPANIAEQLGRSVAAIMTRAARLGLPRRSAPGRKPGYRRTEESRTTRMATTAGLVKNASPQGLEGQMQVVPRICLMCLNKFPSQGRHNRICPSCKASAEYSSGSSVPDFDFKVES